MTFSQTYLEECSKIIDKIDRSKIEDIVNTISELKEIKGRIFFWELVEAQETHRMQ